jgi:hypothetical protein
MTAKEWISEKWPEPIRSKCLEYGRRWTYMSNEEVDCDADALEHAFGWYDTAEGCFQWQKVHDFLSDGMSITEACEEADITFDDVPENPTQDKEGCYVQVMSDGEPFDPVDAQQVIEDTVKERDALTAKIRTLRADLRKNVEVSRKALEEKRTRMGEKE